MKYLCALLFLLLSINPVQAADYLVGVGIAYPFHPNKSHVTTTEAGVLDLTQYFVNTKVGSFGLRETVWIFSSEQGFAGGAGPAWEFRFPLRHDINLFTTASGSIGGSNLAQMCPEVSGTLQFGGQFGIGMELAQRVRVELRYQHLSNGGTTKPNIGLDMILPMVSLRF